MNRRSGTGKDHPRRRSGRWARWGGFSKIQERPRGRFFPEPLSGIRRPGRVPWLALAVMAFWAAVACGAEIHVRSECRATGPMVTLGDLAEVIGTDAGQAQRLGALELFPAPQAQARRFVRVRELQDLLALRGVNLAEHRFSGAAQVAVVGGAEPAATTAPQVLTPTVHKRSERLLSEAIKSYLKQHVPEADAWSVAVTLDASQARSVAAAQSLGVRGGTPPWTGAQRFDVAVEGPAGPVRFSADARVVPPRAVVVSARPLARGTRIAAADVQLGFSQSADDPGTAFHALDDVVGKETCQAIPAGKVIGPDAVRSPVVVRRGEVVTVCARSAGIRVRTMARARDDGSLGQLITVESLEQRKPYFARVSGIQEVEVYARAIASQEDQR